MSSPGITLSLYFVLLAAVPAQAQEPAAVDGSAVGAGREPQTATGGAGRAAAPYDVAASPKDGDTADWTAAEQRLVNAGFNKKFIRALESAYVPSEFRQVVELNVLLYLRKSDYHGPQVTREATDAVRKFIAKHGKTLREAERRFGVTAGPIASLLWLESRHGQNMGRFHVPSVYVHLLQADRPETLEHLKKAASDFGPTTEQTPAEIEARVKTKSEWALGELRAIEAVFNKKYKGRLSALKRWKGSFSGAFGIAQFLPSSYLNFAKPARKGRVPDLTKPEDAIISVAHYLHKHGWIKRRPKTHQDALFQYNKSHDYTEAILKMSQRVRQPASR
ncbi:MAG TPA: lytic murein transglycosylase [Bdellovibrionales bacterium]|nr:lytic murein transglycosylase [Bdellovibrionales bacterium]